MSLVHQVLAQSALSPVHTLAGVSDLEVMVSTLSRLCPSLVIWLVTHIFVLQGSRIIHAATSLLHNAGFPVFSMWVANSEF